MDFHANNGEDYYDYLHNQASTPKKDPAPDERGIVWLGMIPPGQEHKCRYPTEEEVDEMLRQQMEEEEEDGDV